MESSKEAVAKKADAIRALVLSYELSDDDPGLQEEIGRSLLRAVTSLTEKDNVLIKGSRGMRMDTIVSALEKLS